MATVSDPSFGGFNSAEFRTAIENTMMMGLPNTVQERPTFRWRPVSEYTVSDTGGTPYNIKEDVPVSTEAPEDVQIACAVEFISRSTLSGGTAVGDFDTPRAIIYVMDTHYPSVRTANEVLLGGNVYDIDFHAPPIGLFDFTLYVIHASARDEV